MNKVLITGGAGYLGSVLTRFLLEKNYQVTVLDNLMYNQNSLNECCNFENFDFVNGDIRDYNLTNKYISKNLCLIIIMVYKII